MEECPLGNDGPSVAATGSIVGRARSTMPLTVFVTMESPTVTTTRKGAIHRLGTRIHSIAPTTTPITITPWVDASQVMSSSTRRLTGPTWRWAEFAAEESRSRSASLWCISTARTATTMPAAITASRASVNARPVITSASTRLRTKPRSGPGCSRSSSVTMAAGSFPHQWREAARAAAQAAKPQPAETSSTMTNGIRRVCPVVKTGKHS